MKDLSAGDVAGHEVRGELDPVKVQLERARQGADEQGLGEPRDPDQDGVAARCDGDDELVDDLLLADDHPRDLVAELRERLSEALGFGGVGG